MSIRQRGSYCAGALAVGEARARIDVETLKRRVSIVDAVQAFCPGIHLRRQGREFVALSPFKAERMPSFTVDPHRNVFYCFATDQGGDPIRFVEILEACDFATAARRLAERVLGEVPETAEDAARARERAAQRRSEMERIEARETAEQEQRIGIAARIWGQTFDADGTLAAIYLDARGIDLDALARVYGRRIPASLRFHAHLVAGQHSGPVMVGRIIDTAGITTGVHRTFLSPDGTGKARIPNAKLTLGRVWGSFGLLSPLDCADHVLVGEGYETTLTVMAALARRGIRVVGLSALSLNNLAGAGLGHGRRHPTIKGRRLPSEIPDPQRPGLVLPDGIKRLTILEDADGSDPHATRARVARAVAKFRRPGLKIAVATPEAGKDFNDMIQRAA